MSAADSHCEGCVEWQINANACIDCLEQERLDEEKAAEDEHAPY